MRTMRNLGSTAGRLQREVWDRRRSPAVGATGLALLFVVAWAVKDLVDGTSVIHALVAGILTGAVAGVLYWIALRAVQAVGNHEDS